MGFRCPGCYKDFGNDEQKLKEHLEYDCGEGSALAGITDSMLSIKYGIKKSKKSKRVSTPKERYSHVSEDHDFHKTNIVTTDDFYDLVECRDCGLKGKLKFSSYIFDGRISNKKIEECIKN